MKKYILLPVYLLIVALTSCKTSLEINDTEALSLSVEGTVLVPSTGKEINVDVNTDKSDWSYLGGADWVKISKGDSRLTLSVTPNKTSSKRSIPIVIMAGESSQSFSIEQDGGDGAVTSDKSEITVDQWEDQITISVESNDSEWEVVCSASDWLTYTSNPRKRELRVNISENKDVKERVAVFYIHTKTGEGNYEVKLTQNGALYYILPYPGFNETETEVKAFEDGRRSVLIGKPSGGTNPLFGGNSNVWTYQTKSKAFGQIQYIIEPDERLYRAAIVWASDPMFFRRDREIDNTIEFLLKNGFTLRRNTTYYSEKLECTALLGMTNEGSFIMYTFEPKQPAPAATFDKFPWGLLDTPRWRDYTRADIEAWEKAHGGTFLMETNDGEEIALAYSAKEYGGMIRIYKLSLDEDDVRPLKNTLYVFTDTSRVYYKVKGAVMLTKEFAQLARSEGFVFRSYIESVIFMYENVNRGLYMGVYRFLEEDPQDPSVLLEYAKMEFLPISSSDRPQTAVEQMQDMKRREKTDAFISAALSRMSHKQDK